MEAASARETRTAFSQVQLAHQLGVSRTPQLVVSARPPLAVADGPVDERFHDTGCPR